jgi:hypothetical protein
MLTLQGSIKATRQHAIQAVAHAMLQRLQNQAAMQKLRREEGNARKPACAGSHSTSRRGAGSHSISRRGTVALALSFEKALCLAGCTHAAALLDRPGHCQRCVPSKPMLLHITYVVIQGLRRPGWFNRLTHGLLSVLSSIAQELTRAAS